MTGRESLAIIKDQSARSNIDEIASAFVSSVNPRKIILFGSFAEGTYNDDSDFDFYLVLDDGVPLHETCRKAHMAICDLKNRPVDIVVGHESYFEEKRANPRNLLIEGEVQNKGILLYDRRGGLPS